MTEGRSWNWETGKGLLGIDDPAEVDAAFERGERALGAGVIGLALNCPPEVASPRIIRAIEVLDRSRRDFPFTAAAHVARLNGRLTPELFAALRAEGMGGFADHAIRDTLTYVPFRDLPPWFKGQLVRTTVLDKLDAWRLSALYTAEDTWKALRRRRS
ncbi:hypothetical protein STRCI_004732 [Streptomyces cinnabarinus]|uniref:Uncharacterized protein n=1 Tax=Streptomyces cinnabarinus TaxID=67287 RepID=A0ABY7KKB7_9ACTN|nr:hypothetical protein [Streptomyces cinnabarinus]WAZ23391.1 hypothetical protein STRCI_004732 [Streptomyces cinnabarinus]